MEQKREPVIVFENISDIVQIEDLYKYEANLTLGLSEGSDF